MRFVGEECSDLSIDDSLPPNKEQSYQRCHKIGKRDGKPYSDESPTYGKEAEGGDKENELSGDVHGNGFGSLTDGLEIAGDNNLETD